MDELQEIEERTAHMTPYARLVAEVLWSVEQYGKETGEPITWRSWLDLAEQAPVFQGVDNALV